MGGWSVLEIVESSARLKMLSLEGAGDDMVPLSFIKLLDGPLVVDVVDWNRTSKLLIAIGLRPLIAGQQCPGRAIA